MLTSTGMLPPEERLLAHVEGAYRSYQPGRYGEAGGIATAVSHKAAGLNRARALEWAEQTLRFQGATRQKTQRHLQALMPEEQRQTRFYWMAAVVCLLVLLSIVTGLLIHTRRQLRVARIKRTAWLEGTVIPDSPSSSISALTERRLRYMHMIFETPADVAMLIRDDYPHLARKVEHGRLRSRRELYLSVAAIEEALEGRHLTNPSDTVRIDLSRYFKRSPWPWPNSIEAWQHYLETHGPARLDKV